MSFMTFTLVLLAVLVGALAWVLMLQRRHMVTGEGLMVDQAELAGAGLVSVNASDGGGHAQARSEDAALARVRQETDALFSLTEAHDLRRQWDSIQASFVDEPLRAVEEAEKLVAAAMKTLTETFAAERQRVIGGKDASTEDLRQALRRYRSFFSRLVAI